MNLGFLDSFYFCITPVFEIKDILSKLVFTSSLFYTFSEENVQELLLIAKVKRECCVS